MEKIQRIGLQEPILLHVCQHSGLARVEAGNQRIEIIKQMGETYLPTVCLITAKKLLHPGNGTHVYDMKADLRIPLLPRSIPVVERLVAPSSIFKSLHKLRINGFLPIAQTYGQPRKNDVR